MVYVSGKVLECFGGISEWVLSIPSGSERQETGFERELREVSTRPGDTLAPESRLARFAERSTPPCAKSVIARPTPRDQDRPPWRRGARAR
jgi:hypothetical protein